MATTTTITKMLFRRGNDADRQQTILASGEPGFTLDTKRLWIGDGITPGGVPALSARDTHLHYVDTIPTNQGWTTTEAHNFGGAQFLDINVPGLANTLAGNNFQFREEDLENQKWFHPADRDIVTKYDIELTSGDAEIRHSGAGELRIGKNVTPANWTQGDINIGDALKIKPGGVVEIDVDNLVFNGANMIFDGGTATHFEDKTVDLNVVYNDGAQANGPAPAGEGVNSNAAGVYFAHNNYLSAGYMRIGPDNSSADMSTLELAPTVYYDNWESRENGGYVENASGRTPNAGDSNFSQDFDGTQGYADGYKGCKPLRIQSVRPQDGILDFNGRTYTGDAHFVYESGLIVYDSGDPDCGAYNAYKINQSVDTRAVPTFAGINIRNEDGTPGDPMNVSSGGTGQNIFAEGGVLYTIGKHDGGNTSAPLRSMSLGQGELMVGTTNKGVVATKLMGNDEWISIATSEGSGSTNGLNTGVIKIINKFAPEQLKGDSTTRHTWFAKFDTWVADFGSITPIGTTTDPGESVNLKGDTTTDYGGTIKTTAFGDSTNNRGIRISHNMLASGLYDHGEGEYPIFFEGNSKKIQVQDIYAGKTSSDNYLGGLLKSSASGPTNDTATAYQDKGFVTAALTIDPGGHVVGMRSRDLDERYPLKRNMGTGGDNSPIQSPSNFVKQMSTSSDKSHVISSVNFGDYGTIDSYTTQNLHDLFYDRDHFDARKTYVDGQLSGIRSDLGSLESSAFLRDDNSYSTKLIETGFYHGSKVLFDVQDGQTANKIYTEANAWHFKPDSASNTTFHIPINKKYEWKRLTGNNTNNNSSQVMMSLSSDSSGTRFELKDNDVTRLLFEGGQLHYVDGGNLTTINDTGVITNGLTAQGDATIKGGDLYIDNNTTAGSTNIHFQDKNSSSESSPTYRILQWQEANNTWRVEDNTGKFHELLHMGNAQSRLIDNLDFGGRFVDATGDTMTGDLKMGTNKLKGDNIEGSTNLKGLSITSAYMVGKVAAPSDDTIQINSSKGVKITTRKQGRWSPSYPTLQLTGEKGYFGSNQIYADNYHPDADKWTTGRKITLSGDATGEVTIDGSANKTLSVTVLDDKHNHVISNVDGLQGILDGLDSGVTSNEDEIEKLRDEMNNLDSFVPKTGGNFTGGVGVAYGNGQTYLGVDNNYSVIEQKGTYGGHIDFGNIGDDYDGRIAFNTGEKVSGRDRAFSISMNGNNGNSLNFLGGPSYEMFKVNQSGTHIAVACAIGGALNVGTWGQDENSQEGGQINISDPGEVQTGESMRVWSIDNFIDTDNNYRLGSNAHLLRFFRVGIPGDSSDAASGFVVIKNDGTLKAKRDIIAFHSSDITLKDNLTPITDALSKTNQLTGYEFDWNDKQDVYTGHDVGVVAQEVEQVLPEVVDVRDDDTKAVKYEKLVPLLIESIKELSAKVEKLESQLK